MQSRLGFRAGLTFPRVMSSSFAAWPEARQPDKVEIAVVFCKPHSILASVSQEVGFKANGVHEIKLAQPVEQGVLPLF